MRTRVADERADLDFFSTKYYTILSTFVKKLNKIPISCAPWINIHTVLWVWYALGIRARLSSSQRVVKYKLNRGRITLHTHFWLKTHGNFVYAEFKNYTAWNQNCSYFLLKLPWTNWRPPRCLIIRAYHVWIIPLLRAFPSSNRVSH